MSTDFPDPNNIISAGHRTLPSFEKLELKGDPATLMISGDEYLKEYIMDWDVRLLDSAEKSYKKAFEACFPKKLDLTFFIKALETCSPVKIDLMFFILTGLKGVYVRKADWTKVADTREKIIAVQNEIRKRFPKRFYTLKATDNDSSAAAQGPVSWASTLKEMNEKAKGELKESRGVPIRSERSFPLESSIPPEKQITYERPVPQEPEKVKEIRSVPVIKQEKIREIKKNVEAALAKGKGGDHTAALNAVCGQGNAKTLSRDQLLSQNLLNIQLGPKGKKLLSTLLKRDINNLAQLLDDSKDNVVDAMLPFGPTYNDNIYFYFRAFDNWQLAHVNNRKLISLNALGEKPLYLINDKFVAPPVDRISPPAETKKRRPGKPLSGERFDKNSVRQRFDYADINRAERAGLLPEEYEKFIEDFEEALINSIPRRLPWKMLYDKFPDSTYNWKRLSDNREQLLNVELSGVDIKFFNSLDIHLKNGNLKDLPDQINGQIMAFPDGDQFNSYFGAKGGWHKVGLRGNKIEERRSLRGKMPGENNENTIGRQNGRIDKRLGDDAIALIKRDIATRLIKDPEKVPSDIITGNPDLIFYTLEDLKKDPDLLDVELEGKGFEPIRNLRNLKNLLSWDGVDMGFAFQNHETFCCFLRVNGKWIIFHLYGKEILRIESVDEAFPPAEPLASTPAPTEQPSPSEKPYTWYEECERYIEKVEQKCLGKFGGFESLDVYLEKYPGIKKDPARGCSQEIA